MRHRFGRRSEGATKPRRPAEPATEPSPGLSAGHGRGRLPDHLERHTVVHDLADGEKTCPGCGEARACIGEQAAEQLDYDPGAFFVRRTVKTTYACRRCRPESTPVERRFATAGPVEVGPIPRGLCGPGLLAYAVRNWAALGRYAEHGFLTIGNNLAERTLRPVAVGRNNWGVIGSAAAGPTAAVLYAVVGTCKRLGVDPFAYLRDVLPRLHALAANPTDEQLTPLLPDRWRADRPKTNAIDAA